MKPLSQYIISTSNQSTNTMCAPSSSASTTCNSSSISTTEWSDESRVQIIPTAGSPKQREVDISNINHEDLQALREKDAFLYYSIPSVRRAELGFGDSSRSSGVLDSPAAAEASASTTVKRCTRVSFECHSDLLMEDYLSQGFDEQFDEEELARLDHLLSRLFGL